MVRGSSAKSLRSCPSRTYRAAGPCGREPDLTLRPARRGWVQSSLEDLGVAPTPSTSSDGHAFCPAMRTGQEVGQSVGKLPLLRNRTLRSSKSPGCSTSRCFSLSERGRNPSKSDCASASICANAAARSKAPLVQGYERSHVKAAASWDRSPDVSSLAWPPCSQSRPGAVLHGFSPQRSSETRKVCIAHRGSSRISI